MGGRPLSAAARNRAGSRSPLRAAAIIRWAMSLRIISSRPTSQSSSQAASKAAPIAAVTSGSNAPCCPKGLVGMALLPQPFAPHAPVTNWSQVRGLVKYNSGNASICNWLSHSQGRPANPFAGVLAFEVWGITLYVVIPIELP